jgi:hypothetical protein
MKEFNTKLWEEWYLPKKELVDTIVSSIPYFTIDNQNFTIKESFNPLVYIHDLIIFLYFNLNITEYTIYSPVGVNNGKVGFTRLNINDKDFKYFPYIERNI